MTKNIIAFHLFEFHKFGIDKHMIVENQLIKKLALSQIVF